MYWKYKKGQRYFEQNISHLVLEKTSERERERGREAKVLFGDSRGFVGQKSSNPELKFFVSIRATRRHQKGEISPKI